MGEAVFPVIYAENSREHSGVIDILRVTRAPAYNLTTNEFQ
jgi:hypothetical protein